MLEGHTHDVSIIWNFWPFTWFTWPFAWLLNIIFFPIWILFLPLQLIWNFIPDVVTLVIIGLLLLPWVLLFTFVFGSLGFIISVIAGTIMLFLFAFIQSFGWISTIFINDLIVGFSTFFLTILAFDFIGGPIIGTWILIYCFAGIEGYDGKGCAAGISGLIVPASSTTTTT